MMMMMMMMKMNMNHSIYDINGKQQYILGFNILNHWPCVFAKFLAKPAKTGPSLLTDLV